MQASTLATTSMIEFAFEDWAARVNHDGLRDAWIASEQLKATCDWSALPGRCGLCGREAGFALAPGASHAQPDVRESLLCLSCGHSARVRAGLQLLQQRLAQDSTTLPQVYLTEQVTSTFLWLQANLRATLRGSEFQPDQRRLRELTDRFQRAGGRGKVDFQDVTRLTFRDAELDAIVSFDVLEHVPDYRTAIREFARTLRPGGSCIATFPFTDAPDTIVRARLNANGEVEHLLEPEYHGDPISGGVLCYYHFGWDVLEVFRDAGFSSARFAMPWGHEAGYFYGMWTLIATR